ncbi:GM12558 [Drosophila sechellia]|uniref:GM12558 n=1 Tax=Drosophila sechellia TaxID=7238 RepID=B4I069_DROSE|nr:GM12558 [Drosophila sechellia]
MFTTLHSEYTEYLADSVERLTHDDVATGFFACGTYQLVQEVGDPAAEISAKRPRKGLVYLYQFKKENCRLERDTPPNPNKLYAEDSLDQATDNIEESNETNLNMYNELEEQKDPEKKISCHHPWQAIDNACNRLSPGAVIDTPPNPNKLYAEDSLDQATDNIEESNETNLNMYNELEEQKDPEKKISLLKMRMKQVNEKFDENLAKQEAVQAKLRKVLEKMKDCKDFEEGQ